MTRLGLAALAAPAQLSIAGTGDVSRHELQPLRAVYQVVGGEFELEADPLTPDEVAAKLVE